MGFRSCRIGGLLQNHLHGCGSFTTSITHGAWFTNGARTYPEHLAERVRGELLRFRDIIINTGVSGEISTGLLADFEWRVLRFNPDVVSIKLGMNDCARIPVEQHKKDVAAEMFRVIGIHDPESNTCKLSQ